MLDVSYEFRSKLSQNSKTLFKAELRLADGTVRELVGDDVMMSGISFTEGTSGSGSFDIGSAIMGKLGLTLNNWDERFSDYVFTDATIVPYVGIEMDDGSPEWLAKGVYGVDQPESYGNTIGLEALDGMRKLEKPYSEVATAYPASLLTIAQEICTACGVFMADAEFANCDYTVPRRPDDSTLTCMQMISHVAQASGNWAKFDSWGRLQISWYDTRAFEGEDWLDGDRFDDGDPYASGDAADGGDFLDYSSGDAASGGDFGADRYAYLHAISSVTMATDDVVVTGVRVTARDQVRADGSTGAAGETALHGSEGYVLEISENPLVQYGEAAEVARRVGMRAAGMRFRPFDVSGVGNPAIEAGDPVILLDRKMNQYASYITSLTYKVGGYEAFACSAETPSRNSAASYSAMTRAIVEARNAVRAERTAREVAQADLRGLIESSSGLFMTTEPQQDGSNVYYMHDKQALRGSSIIWRLAADALTISTDGGRTYPYGIDVTGTAILDRIYATGIDASYLVTGSIRSADNQSWWDLNNSVLHTKNMVAVDMSASGSLTTESEYGRTVVTAGLLDFYYVKGRDIHTGEPSDGQILRAGFIGPAYFNEIPMLNLGSDKAIRAAVGTAYQSPGPDADYVEVMLQKRRFDVRATFTTSSKLWNLSFSLDTGIEASVQANSLMVKDDRVWITSDTTQTIWMDYSIRSTVVKTGGYRMTLDLQADGIWASGTFDINGTAVARSGRGYTGTLKDANNNTFRVIGGIVCQ